MKQLLRACFLAIALSLGLGWLLGLSTTPVAHAADFSVTRSDVPITGLTAGNDSPTLLGGTTALSATNANGPGVSYEWVFGDGETGAGQPIGRPSAGKGGTQLLLPLGSDGS